MNKTLCRALTAVYRAFCRVYHPVAVEGAGNLPKEGAAIVFANHQNLQDPLVLCSFLPRPIFFMAKKELFKNRLFARALDQLGAFPVARGELDMSAIRTSLSVLKNGEVLGIFPEGHRYTDGEIHAAGNGVSLIALRSGAPVDYLLAEDLEDHPGDYKLYVFLYNMHYDEGFKRAVAKLRDRGVTMLWTWAPGWSTGTRSGVDCMEELTGIRFAQFDKPMDARILKKDGTKMGLVSPRMSPLFYPVSPCDEVLGTYDGSDKPGLVVFRQGKSTVFFSGTWQLDMDFIRQVIERAGVFTYVDSHDPIEANEKLFALHARYPGLKTVKLPQRVAEVYDVFGKKIIAEDTDTFTFDAPLHSSWLFYLKPARPWWKRFLPK